MDKKLDMLEKYGIEFDDIAKVFAERCVNNWDNISNVNLEHIDVNKICFIHDTTQNPKQIGRKIAGDFDIPEAYSMLFMREIPEYKNILWFIRIYDLFYEMDTKTQLLLIHHELMHAPRCEKCQSIASLGGISRFKKGSHCPECKKLFDTGEEEFICDHDVKVKIETFTQSLNKLNSSKFGHINLVADKFSGK
jgi:hypothetical protein